MSKLALNLLCKSAVFEFIHLSQLSDTCVHRFAPQFFLKLIFIFFIYLYYFLKRLYCYAVQASLEDSFKSHKNSLVPTP